MFDKVNNTHAFSFTLQYAAICHMTLTQLPLAAAARCQRTRLESLHMRRPQHCQLAPLSTYPYPFLLSSTPLLARTVCFSRFVCSRSLALSVNLISFNALGLFAQLAAAVAAGGRRWKEVVRGRGRGSSSGNGSRGQHQRRLRQRFLLLNAKNTKNSETKHAAAALH